MPRTPSNERRLLQARWFRVLAGIVALVLLAALVFLAGPRNAFGPNVPTARAQAPHDIAQLDDWLRQTEAAVPDIKPRMKNTSAGPAPPASAHAGPWSTSTASPPAAWRPRH